MGIPITAVMVAVTGALVLGLSFGHYFTRLDTSGLRSTSKKLLQVLELAMTDMERTGYTTEPTIARMEKVLQEHIDRTK